MSSNANNNPQQNNEGGDATPGPGPNNNAPVRGGFHGVSPRGPRGFPRGNFQAMYGGPSRGMQPVNRGGSSASGFGGATQARPAPAPAPTPAPITAAPPTPATAPLQTPKLRGPDRRLPDEWELSDFPNQEAMDEAFYKFREERGAVRVKAQYEAIEVHKGRKGPGSLRAHTSGAARDRFQRQVWNTREGLLGTEWQTEPSDPRDFGKDSHLELPFISIHKTAEEAEKHRLKTLAELNKAIKTVSSETAAWRDLDNAIKAYSKPLVKCVAHARQDNERGMPPFVDARRSLAALQDVVVNREADTNIETTERFSRHIAAMQAAGAIPGKNCEWKAGTTWGSSEMKFTVDDAGQAKEGENENATEEEESDRTAAATHHAFLPRHARPARIGLGYYGYDDIFRQQRDGKSFSSKDVSPGPWTKERGAPITFTSKDETSDKYVDVKLRPDNPLFKQNAPTEQDDLYKIMSDSEAQNQKRAENRKQSRAVQGNENASGTVGGGNSTRVKRTPQW